MADISKIVLPDSTEYEIKDAKARMVILRYGISTWNDFITAYQNNCVMYCRASSNSNPATGSQTRLAFMAYVSNADTPTNVEFQYYRSMNKHTDAQQGDQVFVYKLTNANKWTVTTRNAFSKVIAGTNLTSSFVESETTSSITLSADCDTTVTEDSTKLITSGAVYDALSTKSDKIGLNTITGDYSVVTFTTDCIAPMSKIVSNITPVQDLHGYSKPWSGGGGKNKLEPCITSGTVNGITYTVNDDGTIKLSNTATSEAIKAGNFDLKAGSYIYTSGVTESFDTYDTYLSVGGTTIARGISGYNSFTLAQDSTVMLGVRVRNGITPNVTIKPMIRLSSVTDATFEPYENICPISGFSALNVTRTGVNLWDEQTRNGYYKVDGTFQSYSGNLATVNPIRVMPNTNYRLLVSGGTGAIGRVCWYDVNGTFISTQVPQTSNIVLTSPANAYYLNFDLTGSYGTTYGNNVAVLYPSTQTTYTPYNGQTATVNFGQTVYGGVADVTGGKVTKTYGIVDLGNLNWASTTQNRFYSGGIASLAAVPSSSSTKIGLICSHYEEKTADETYLQNTGIALATNGNLLIYDSALVGKTAGEVKTTLTGVQLVYPLATPIEITTTPENLTAISGENNVYADTGDLTEVAYFEHVDNNLIKLIKACQL